MNTKIKTKDNAPTKENIRAIRDITPVVWTQIKILSIQKGLTIAKTIKLLVEHYLKTTK